MPCRAGVNEEVASYRVTVVSIDAHGNPGNAVHAVRLSNNTCCGGCMHTLTPLEPSSHYSVWVRAVNARAASPPSMPLVAIGGVSLERAPGVLAAGADGIAVIAAVTQASDCRAAIAQWQALWSGASE